MELKNTIIGQMAMASLTNPKWDNLSKEDAEKRIEELGIKIADNVTYGSEIKAVEGIEKALGIELITKLIGTKNEEGKWNRDGEIYTSNDLTSIEELKTLMDGETKERKILDILSVVHDGWVKDNPDNFLKKGRNKEFQFVPLELLNWGEIESDLIFLKPILEAANIEVDEKVLKEEFDLKQKEFLITNEIFSTEDLKNKLSRGASFYPALSNLETGNGENICELLANNSKVLDEMTKQIDEQIGIKTREELALDIIKSDNTKLDEMQWIETTKNEFDLGDTNRPISKREILLSKTIGKPYPTYFLGPVHNTAGDLYQNKLRKPVGEEIEEVEQVKREKSDRIDNLTEEDNKIGKISFGEKDILEDIEGKLYITQKDLILAGLSPKMMGWGEVREEELIKDELLNGDTEIGFVKTFLGSERYISGDKNQRELAPNISKPMTRAMFELGKEKGIGFPKKIVLWPAQYDAETIYSNEFKSFEECTDVQKQEIEDRIEKLEKLKEKIDKDTTGKYDKQGTLLIPKYETPKNNSFFATQEVEIVGYHKIEVTQRELVEAGILPEELKWKENKKAKVSTKNIANIDKNANMNEKDMEKPRNFFQRILDKVKENDR